MKSFADIMEERFQSAWKRTDDLFGLLKPEAALAQPIVWRHPFIFYVGHLPAFAWNQICRNLMGHKSFKPRFDEIFCRGIDPDIDTGSCHSHPDVPEAWPDFAEVLLYRDRVREAVLESLDAGRSDAIREPKPNARQAFHMVFEHELMHQETLLYMVQELPPELKARPQGLPEYSIQRGEPEQEIRIAGGRTRLGASPSSIEFGWDNEFQEQIVDVPAFRVGSTPVTNGRFFDFMESGGYEDPYYWGRGDWAWKSRQGVRHPNFWMKLRGEWFYRTLFDLLPLSAVTEWPVYVSLAEAKAYARWKGRRLPTEAEYSRAAYCGPNGREVPFPWGDDELSAARGNFDFVHWSPTPVGSNPQGASPWGVHELVGNGWEWTETPFAPFPGFVPLESYPEYSADFFDGKHYVLKGASWATAADLLRPSFRNWYQAHYPYVFAKFRCVSEM
jgi:iron(II)-dependent oxidoreductase